MTTTSSTLMNKHISVNSKASLRLGLSADVEKWLQEGNSIKQVQSRKRSRYINPVPLSPITQARCQIYAVRKAEAKRVAHLFPSSVDPGVARALSRGRGYGRRRTARVNPSNYQAGDFRNVEL